LAGRQQKAGLAHLYRETGEFPVRRALAQKQDLLRGRAIGRAGKGRSKMPLINVVVTLLVVGILLWLINRYVPMQGTIKGILNAVVVIVVVLWIVNVFGLFHYVSQFKVGQ
jgi:hypothetical protein